MPNHIYIMGLMGSGKSRLGKELAPKLGLPFIDLDRYIEQATGKTINDIFATEGEARFRELESQYLREVAALPRSVVSLGGGTPCYFDNIQIIKASGQSVYLQVPLGILVSRLANAKKIRPLLADKDEAGIKAVLEKQQADREHYYSQADFTIESDGKLKADDLVRLLG